MAEGAPQAARRLPEDNLSGDGVAGRVIRGGAQRIAGFGAANLLITVAMLLLLRHLEVDEWGRYGAVMALMAIVGGLTDAGLNVVGTRELALTEPGPQRRRLAGTILGIRLVLAVIGVLIAVVFTVIVGYRPLMVTGAAVAGIGVIGIAAQSALCLPAQVELRNGPLAIVEFAKGAIQTGLTIAGVAAGAGLLAFFGVQAAVGIGILLLLPLILGRQILVRPRYDRDDWLKVMRAALPVAIAGVLAVLYLRIVVVLCSLLVDDYETGLLNTSARLVEVVAAVPLLLGGVLLPVATVAARDNPARLRYVAQRLAESGLLLGVAAALGFGFGAHALVTTLGGADYVEAAPVLAIQGLTIITVFIVQMAVVVLVASHHQNAIVKANLIGLAVVLVGSVVLLQVDGARGGATAVLIADLVLAGAMLVAVRRAGVILSAGLFPRIAVAAAAGVVAGFATITLPSALTGLIAMATFGVVAVLARALPSELQDAILRR